MKNKELNTLPYKKASRGDIHVFQTPESIESLDQFLPLLDVLEDAHEDEIVKINIFCYGGSLAVVKAITNAMMSSRATVHTVNKGVAYSGGSAILMAGDTIEVDPMSNLMIHSSHGWLGYDTEAEHFTSTEYHRKELQEYYHFIYKDFLTEDEINDVLKGTPVWMNSEEQNKRFEKMFESREKEHKEFLDQMSPPSREELMKLTKREILNMFMGEEED